MWNGKIDEAEIEGRKSEKSYNLFLNFCIHTDVFCTRTPSCTFSHTSNHCDFLSSHKKFSFIVIYKNRRKRPSSRQNNPTMAVVSSDHASPSMSADLISSEGARLYTASDIIENNKNESTFLTVIGEARARSKARYGERRRHANSKYVDDNDAKLSPPR